MESITRILPALVSLTFLVESDEGATYTVTVKDEGPDFIPQYRKIQIDVFNDKGERVTYWNGPELSLDCGVKTATAVARSLTTKEVELHQALSDF